MFFFPLIPFFIMVPCLGFVGFGRVGVFLE